VAIAASPRLSIAVLWQGIKHRAQKAFISAGAGSVSIGVIIGASGWGTAFRNLP